jgi:hypothetical protein
MATQFFNILFLFEGIKEEGLGEEVGALFN